MSEMLILMPKMYDLDFHSGHAPRPTTVYAETVPAFWPDQAGGRKVVIQSGSKEAMEVLGRSLGKLVVCEAQRYHPYPDYFPSYKDELLVTKARRV